jgi:hypothetical protein
VTLSTGASRRLALYNKQLRSHNNDIAANMAAFPAPGTKGKKKKPIPDEAFPVQLSVYFDDNFAGQGKTYADIEVMLLWAEQQIANDATEYMVPFELLIHEEQEGEIVNSTDNNYLQWLETKRTSADTTAGTASSTPGQAGPSVTPTTLPSKTNTEGSTPPSSPATPTPAARKSKKRKGKMAETAEEREDREAAEILMGMKTPKQKS